MTDAAPPEPDTSIKAYKAAHARWQEWLGNDGQHAISGQLSQLFWQDAAFRTFNEARKKAAERGPASAVAPILARFIDEGYVAGQVLGISKLVERSDPKQPKKGVISLRRVIDDMVAHRHLLTRANYLALHDLPYDPEPARKAAFAKAIEKAEDGVAVYWEAVGGQEDYSGSVDAHAQFDRLSGVSPDARQPGDLIAEATLKKLGDALDDDAFKVIRDYRHKVLAHAADAYSRKQVPDLPQGIKLEQVDRALWILCGVFQVISATLLQGAWRGGAVPVPQYDHLEHLDQPFAAAEVIPELHTFWKEHSDVREKWLSEAYEALMPSPAAATG